MVIRSSRPLALIVATAILAGCQRGEAAAPLAVGTAAPAALAASSSNAVRATWIFDGADLLRCRSSARELRHLQARFGDGVEVRAIALDADSAYVRSFFRLQRVHAPVLYLDRDAARSALPGAVAPALYVTRGGRIEAIYPGVPLDDSESIRKRDVEGRVLALLGRSAGDSSSKPFPSGNR